VSRQANQRNSGGERIEPVPFRPSRRGTRWNRRRFRWLFGTASVLILFFLCGGAWFVFTARQVQIEIDPLPDRMAIEGGIAAPRVGTRYLMRPGDYTLVARKACYRVLTHRFTVGPAKFQNVRLALTRLPGKLEVNAHQAGRPGRAIVDATVRVDGTRIGTTPLPAFEIDAGSHRLDVSAPNYKPYARDISIEGCGNLQTLDLALDPGWSNLTISSAPAGATVVIDGEIRGKTPARIDLAEGAYEIRLKAAGFKDWRQKIEITAGQPLKLEDVRLEPADGRLTITSVPSGARIEIDGRPIGRTPVTTGIAPGRQHQVEIFKPGYAPARRTVQLKRAASETLNISLEPQTGTVRLEIEPPDAEIWIDGARKEMPGRAIVLKTTEHDLEVRKKGFLSYRKKILPRADVPLDLKIVLKAEHRASADRISAPNGYPLRLVPPGAFTMGSSRREQGRRSNETIRSVQLTRPFYIGVREVTNSEFRQFQPGHRSGEYRGQSLDDEAKPVVSVSWEQAALFCNWLSRKASLPPVYVKREGRMVAADPVGAGYRLPTEAEWAFAARQITASTASGDKFPWGKGYPPPPGSGNFADASAKTVLGSYMKPYNDGYPLTAPPGQFKPNRLGLYDLSGNVAEWCHDYYQIYRSGRKFVDPTGPGTGRHHVVRGSSWRHGSISTLRISYRDYSDSKRQDLGFRIARYAE
jgi:formylglycine-generating enzyme required for sulfatase activity